MKKLKINIRVLKKFETWDIRIKNMVLISKKLINDPLTRVLLSIILKLNNEWDKKIINLLLNKNENSNPNF